jgi:hypothetical protein
MVRFVKVFVISVVLALALVMVSCGGDDDPADPGDGGGGNGGGNNVVFVTEDVETPTVWSGDSIYVIMAYDFYVESPLTIQPGTIVKFHPSAGPYCVLSGSGVINAQGTSGNPIVFTSYLDDAHGGDTNGDGTATSPARRDWGEINTNDRNGSTFQYCEFYYGGAVNYRATLTLYGNNITVSNCLFAHNDGSYTASAGDVGVLDASDGGSDVVIQNNVFYDNIRPLSISTRFTLDNSNVFHNPANASQTNTHNGIFVETIDDLHYNIAWRETEVAFVIDDNDFWIESGYTLTLGNNVVLKFKSDSVMLLEDGASAIVNRAGTGVYFTCYLDDSRKGDTNGDGNATSPDDGDWVGIYDDSMAIQPPYYFIWSNIYYDDY